MLPNAKVTAFIVSELLKKNQQIKEIKEIKQIPLAPTQIRVKKLLFWLYWYNNGSVFLVFDSI